MSYIALAAVATVAAILYLATIARRNGVLAMDGWFVLSHWVMTIGTLSLLNPAMDAAAPGYATVVTVPYLIFILTSTGAHFALVRRTSTTTSKPRVLSVPIRPHIAILLTIAVILTLLYYRAVGYNTFILGLRDLASGQTSDYTTLRLESYSSTRYLFPGYINQFKNAILPALTIVVAHRLYKLGHPFRLTTSFALAGACLLALLGTGQRGAFIQFSLIGLTFIYFYNRKRFGRRALLASIVAIPPVIVTTFLLGRSGSVRDASNSNTDRLLGIFGELGRRVFHDNQYSGIVGYAYTYDQPGQNGAEWIAGAKGILPGHPGSPLARQIFASLYGSDRGTAPPSLWGSVHFNWGWAGLIVIPIVLAIAFQLASRPAANLTNTNTLSLIGMSGCFVIVGNWVAGGPDYLLNAGAVTYAILWWMGRREAIADDEPPGGARTDEPAPKWMSSSVAHNSGVRNA